MRYSTSASLKLSYDLDEQHVSFSRALWNAVSQNNEANSIPVSVTIPSLVAKVPVGSDGNDNGLHSFLAHAQLHPDSQVDNDIGEQCDKHTVYVSGALIRSIYGTDALIQLEEDEAMEGGDVDTEEQEGGVVQVAPVQLVELNEIILGALNPASLELAEKDRTLLSSLFSPSTGDPLIIRSGGRYTFGEYAFRVMMTSPVQQGFMVSSQATKLLVVDMYESGESVTLSGAVDQASEVPTLSMLEANQTSEAMKPQEFHVQILHQPWPESRLFPAPEKQDDPENRVFVSVKDLARCGVFSGDWVLVGGVETSKTRLCRVFGVDGISNESHVYVGPALYFNLGLPLPPSPMENAKLYITRLTVNPLAGPPPASAVSIARIASGSSMNKSLQTPLLEALKTWFEEKERVVCKGDVITVCLDEDSARLRPQDDDEITMKESRAPTTLGYFIVTSLEDDGQTVDSALYGSGRKILPSHTKMVQTGVEHSRVPVGTLSHYYGLARKLPLQRPDTTAYTQLRELVSSSLHPLGRDFQLSCNALVHGPRGGGKATVIREIVEELGIHLFEFSVYDVISETDAKTEVYLRAKFDKAAALAPCVVLIRSIEGLAKKSAVVESGQEPLLATVLQECIADVNAAHETTGYPVMVIATTSDIDSLPTSVLACFRHEVVIEAPDEKARLQILKNLTLDSPIAPDVSLNSLATQTAALVGKDLVDLVSRAGVAALQRIHRSIFREDANHQHISPGDIEAAGVVLTAADFDAALSEARASYSDSIGAPKIPNVTWDDVGGLAHVKDDILDTIQLPLEHPELFGSGLKKRSGILLYGPPGTGKTLLAKAIATSCSLNFFSVKGPELLNMYIGESEANVRRVFQRARDAKPCVIFFDELDSVAPKRGEKGDSGGVMDRIVSQLLAELDGMSEGGEGSGVGDVFVIGATNRPDLLDPALLRPGRFDKLLYLGVSQDHESQLRIIEALSRKFRLHPDLDLSRVAERCPFHYTGADFYALCSDAMLKAMTRVAEGIEAKVNALNQEGRKDLPQPVTVQYFLSRLATPEDIMVQVEECDYIRALEELVPSVSAAELQHYQSVREKFEKIEDPEAEDSE